MRKTITPLFLLCCVFFLGTLSCSKEGDDKPKSPQQDQLPPITQTGTYTFGCLMDGQVWLPKHYSNSIVNPPVVLQATWDQQNQGNGKRFIINARHWRKDDVSPKEGIVIYTNTDSILSKIYLDVGFLIDSVAKSGVIYDHEAYKNGPFTIYHSIIGKNSWMHFSRFDTVSRIASGTFSIDLLNKDDDQDTVQIREGRFDVPF